jgi:transposase
VMVPESRGQKNDAKDAFALAEQLRTGAIPKHVFKEVGEYGTLRELGRTHTMIVQDVVRVQNRIKALFRSRGVAVVGKSVYSEEGREACLKKLPPASRGAATTLYAQYDAVEAIRRQAEKDLVTEAHRHPMSRVLESCPGLGPIRVAQLLPIVVSPARFRTKRQFWSYCGLGIVMRSSSDWVRKPDGGWARAEVKQTRGLNVNHNSTLKSVFKGAATTVITQLETEPLHQDYQRLIAAGTKPNLAKLTIARKLAAIALSMWKSHGEVRPDEASQARRKTRLSCGHVDPQGGYDRWQRTWRRARFEGEHPLLVWPGSKRPEVPRLGYAPSEYQRKPWSEEAQIEGWFPLHAREHTCFDRFEDASVNRRTTGERPSPAGVSSFAGHGGREDDRARHEGLGAGPLNADQPPCSRPPHASTPRRTCRLEADASVEEHGWRAGGIRLDTSFHRKTSKAPFWKHSISHRFFVRSPTSSSQSSRRTSFATRRGSRR